ncbi:MAG: VOC family protein [Fimbriimonas sp.]
MNQQLANLILDVEDIERSLEFYCGLLALPLSKRENVDGNRLAYLATGPTCLMLIEQPPKERNPDLQRPGGLVVKFNVIGIRTIASELKRREQDVLQDLNEPLCGESTLLVRDPDGYAILLAEPVVEC